MVDPDCVACPKCKTPWYALKSTNHWRMNKDGDIKRSGRFESCECGAYTRSTTGRRQFNLRTSIARRHGIVRKGTVRTQLSLPL